ncbi:MAG: tRNA (adenosine(37)-N6)-dimethylallyltransferase MiaA [Pseudorhodobacter sp.]
MWDEWVKIPPDRPVLIAGPTASGKSDLAMKIAGATGGVIVNADALQVYDCWRVLTARPSPADEAALPHRLYGHIGRQSPYSVGHWLHEVAQILKGKERLIIVGGTGLYFTALTEGLAEIPPIPPDVRVRANHLLAKDGLAAMLTEIDPQTVGKIDRANPARVQRAWEVLQATGRGLAAWQAETAPPLLPPERAETIVLRPRRDWINDRIDLRFRMMMARGALEEARAALPDWDPALPSSRAIGAPELVAHLRGEITREAAIEAAQLASRQYAKRQRTWFRNRLKTWKTVDPT